MRVALTCAAAVVGAGCELVFPVHAGPGRDPDAANADAAAVDAEAADATPLGPFSPPTQISIATMIPVGGYVTDPALTGDERQLMFVVQGTTLDSADIRVAASTGDPLVWDSVQTLPFSLGGRTESNPKLIFAGTVVWFYAATGATPGDVQAWSRADADAAPWMDTTATDALGLATAMDERPGGPTADGLHMIIHRKTAAAPTGELIEYERIVGGPWHPTFNDTMEKINLVRPTNNAHLIDDGLTIVFSGTVGAQTDLFIAHRPALGLSFPEAAPIVEVNDPVINEGDPWLSQDGRRLWFSRVEAPAVTANWAIYYSERTPL